MRLIDADAVLKELKKSCEYHAENSRELSLLQRDIIIVQEQPTVDAVPARHGKWIIRDNPGTGWYRITCSECGEDVTSTAPCIGFFPNAKVVWDYCPYCGADMRGETNE